ncbi:MAG: triple tyrosine motif-containing protein [Pyrinomonadaceae bacterium]
MTSISYGTADGMKTRECSGGGHPAGWKTSDGKLWFSTIKGAVMIDPENIRINRQAPPVTIEAVTVDGEAFDPLQPATLAAGKTSFDFQFAGLSFIAPEKVTYQYKLEGFDRDWVEAGTRREAFYTNIPPGDYRFRVMASNNDGVWNETGAAFDFRLDPHFHQTYWFYLLCAAALGLIAWQLYLMRVRRMREQFSAVLQERNRIAREIHDTLAQGFAGISVQLELVARMIRAQAQEAAQTHLDQARILVRTSLAEARRSVWDLRSHALESGGLPEALSETITRLTAGTPAQAKVQISGAARALSPVVENNLLRIGQEAVTNAIKHAAAQHILVELSFNGPRVRLAVRDDGRGFAAHNNQRPSATDGHFGLFGMRERAEQIGGKLIVNSAPGSGTEIICEVKLGD